jgi:uncharacterized protein
VDGELRLREVGQDDLPALQDLIESDPGYAERVTGYPPGSADALSLVMMRPDGLAEDAKSVLAAWEPADRMIAVVDLIRGYPDADCAYVGLLQVRWEMQRGGLGAAVWRDAERWVRERWPEIQRFRLAVVDTNARIAEPFWRRMGFCATGEVKPYRYDKLASSARLYEKRLTGERS